MKTMIKGKDAALEESLEKMTAKLKEIGLDVEVASILNPLPHVWSAHIRDRNCKMSFTNGKGASKESALCSAYGEFLERMSCNYLHANWFLGQEIADGEFVHYPNERWFPIGDGTIPNDLMDEKLLNFYNPNNDLKMYHIVDNNSGNIKRGVCALPFVRQSDKKTIYIPMNIVGNLYVSNGMSAGNSVFETRVQCLSEIFERAVKNKIILEEISLPTVPLEFLKKFPSILEGISKLEEAGFPVIVKDASLGGIYPVVNVTLLNPKNGGVYASFGAHPNFEVALERTLTELLQGRTLETLDVAQKPTFKSEAVSNHDNIEDHFIDSTGVISWKFFSNKSPYQFTPWNFEGTTEAEYNYLMSLLKKENKEVYIADYEHLGISACRIIVPDYSEIYEVNDLIWDNNNRAIKYRTSILNIFELSNEELLELMDNLYDDAIDDYTLLSELISVPFDTDTLWGQITVGELKLLSSLVLGHFEEAQELASLYLEFGSCKQSQKNFYQALESILIILNSEEELNVSDYVETMNKLFGNQIVKDALDSVNGVVKFVGLTPTDLNFKGLIQAQNLQASYKKLQIAKKIYWEKNGN